MAVENVLPYRVDFENEEDATVPAQIVTITDQLDASLDWSTFELTEIAFGDQLLAVPAGSQHFETTVPVSYGGVDFEVQIEAGIHADTGEVYANLYSIDPITGLPPAVDIGFLPPEDGTGRGQGHISYVLKPKPDLVTGTEIRNVALIQFDFGEIIATNQRDPHDPSKGTDVTKEALVTIDAVPPTAAVRPLPPLVASRFTVAWSGKDDPGGSGVASYDLYVSTNGGGYVPWLEDTADTEGTFSGQAGRRYCFKALATDHVGYRTSLAGAQEVCTRTTGPSVRVDLPAEGGVTNVLVQGGELVVRHGGSELFRGPADWLTKLTINGSPAADTIVISNLGSAFAATTVILAGAGSDKLRVANDAGAETATLRPGVARLKRSRYLLRARGAETVIVSGGQGDRAYLYDSAGDDRFVGRSGRSTMRGAGYYSLARGFERVIALAKAGGRDKATLRASAGSDRLTAGPARSVLKGDGFRLTARGFDTVVAVGSKGGNDRATFTGSRGNERFSARPGSASLTGDGFKIVARKFARVYARMKKGGNDRAVLNDSTGNDRFRGIQSKGVLSGPGQWVQVVGFRRVKLVSKKGGTDKLSVDAIDYLLETVGAWSGAGA